MYCRCSFKVACDAENVYIGLQPENSLVNYDIISHCIRICFTKLGPEVHSREVTPATHCGLFFPILKVDKKVANFVAGHNLFICDSYSWTLPKSRTDGKIYVATLEQIGGLLVSVDLVRSESTEEPKVIIIFSQITELLIFFLVVFIFCV
jgi:hypothetical protein